MVNRFKVGDRIQFTPAALATFDAITQAESQGTIRAIEEAPGERRRLQIEFDDGSLEWWYQSEGFELIES